MWTSHHRGVIAVISSLDYRTQVVATLPGNDVVIHDHLHRRLLPARPAQHLQDDRPHKLLEGHHRRNRITRQPNKGYPLNLPEGQGLAGLHLHLPEMHLALNTENVFHHIIIPYRHPGRGKKEIHASGQTLFNLGL